MPTTRELRDRIRSIDNTMKITNAMYLISSTKMRKARQELKNTEPYFYTLHDMMARIIRHLPQDYSHPYLDARMEVPEVERNQAIVCVTADKGLAGAYNHNVLKETERLLHKYPNAKLYVVGEMGRVYFHARHILIEEAFHYTAQNPSLHRARVITGRMLDLFSSKQIDQLFLVYTQMINSLESETKTEQLLPLSHLSGIFRERQIQRTGYNEEFHLFPSPDAVIRNVIPDYLNGFIYGALVESFCSEQNARMTAMEAANRNGSKLKQQLSTLYNRVRQAQITQEITEVAAGAKAQKRAKELREKHNPAKKTERN